MNERYLRSSSAAACLMEVVVDSCPGRGVIRPHTINCRARHLHRIIFVHDQLLLFCSPMENRFSETHVHARSREAIGARERGACYFGCIPHQRGARGSSRIPLGNLSSIASTRSRLSQPLLDLSDGLYSSSLGCDDPSLFAHYMHKEHPGGRRPMRQRETECFVQSGHCGGGRWSKGNRKGKPKRDHRAFSSTWYEQNGFVSGTGDRHEQHLQRTGSAERVIANVGERTEASGKTCVRMGR